MNTVKENILKAVAQNYKGKGELFCDFKLELAQDTADERAAQSLIFAFNAWTSLQWRINDSLRDIVNDATKIQKSIKECKDINTKVLWAQSQLNDHVAKSKEVENGIWQLCSVIGLSPTETNAVFKKVHSFIDFDSFI